MPLVLSFAASWRHLRGAAIVALRGRGYHVARLPQSLDVEKQEMETELVCERSKFRGVVVVADADAARVGVE